MANIEMKLLRYIVFMSLVFTIASCNIFRTGTSQSDNELSEGKIIAKSFPIDKKEPFFAQRKLEEEQLRLRKLYPDLNLVGFIKPNSPWILITENCLTKTEYKQILKQISKECPKAKVVPCD